MPTLPAAALSRFTATCVAVAWLPLTATPPPMASPGLAAAKVLAMCSSVASGTPLSSATFLGSTPAAASAKRLSAPCSVMSLRMASATAASVPGALRTHSSALEAVSDWRGSTWMKVPALPSRKVCMREKPRA